MTDRETRVQTLRQAAAAKSERKEKDARDAIARLRKQKTPISFRAVSREAGVSHTFLYEHEDLRAEIKRLQATRLPKKAPPEASNGDGSVVRVLTERLRQANRQHHEELDALRRQLEAAHGEIIELKRQLRRTPSS